MTRGASRARHPVPELDESIVRRRTTLAPFANDQARTSKGAALAVARLLTRQVGEGAHSGGGELASAEVLQLQATAGNRAVARVVQRQKPTTTAPPKRKRRRKPSTAPAAKTKGSTKESTTPAPAAKPGPTPGTEPGVVDFGFFDATTYAMLAAGLRGLVQDLQRDIEGLPASDAWGDADEWIMDVNPWIPWLESFGQKRIEATVANLAEGKLADYRRISDAVREEHTWPLRKAYWEAQVAAEKAAKEAEETAGQIADALRSSYRSGDTDKIKEVLTIPKTAVSLGRNLRTVASGFATEVLMIEKPQSTTKVRIPTGDPMGRAPMNKPLGQIKLETVDVNKYVEKMDQLARGMAGANLLLTIRGRRDKKTTDVEQGLKDLTDTVSVFSDIGTLVGGLPPHVSLITTAYITPALKAMGPLLARVVESLHEANKAFVEAFGDVYYPGAEPGGQEMFNFMVATMRARTEADAPVVGGSVQEYMFDHRKKLGAGTEATVPTEGWGPLRKLDRAGARRWAFQHRERIWQLLYGSMIVPRR